MIEIKTDDVELLKETCESLAYEIAQMQNANAYSISEYQVCGILKCEGLEVYVSEQ